MTTSIRRLVLTTCLPHKYDVFSWSCFGHDDTQLFTTLYGHHFDVYSDIVFEVNESFVTFSCCSPQEMTGTLRLCYKKFMLGDYIVNVDCAIKHKVI